jgi:hypothetical protein
MKTVKAAKGERRAHRKAKDRRRRGGGLELSTTSMFGPMDRDRMDAILTALETAGLDAPWDQAAPRIMPVIKRFRQPFAPGFEPIYITIPPGIRTGFGVDVGPAFSHVDRAMVERWGVSGATLLATALDNLSLAVVREPPRVDRIERDGIPIVTVQGQGWGSSLILAPHLLGADQRILMTPVRNLLLAVPEAATLDFIEDLYLDVAEGAHDALDAQILRWNGNAVVDLSDRSVSLPN